MTKVIEGTLVKVCAWYDNEWGFRTACSIPLWPGREPREAGRLGRGILKIIKMMSLDLKDKRVLIREDLNVPIQDGVVTSDARIRASLPTIQAALTARARVLVMSHLGRPEEGKYAEEFSLAPVARRLAQLLGCRWRSRRTG